MRIVCQQTILMKYHAELLFLKKRQNLKLSLLQIIGGALRVNVLLSMKTCKKAALRKRGNPHEILRFLVPEHVSK